MKKIWQSFWPEGIYGELRPQRVGFGPYKRVGGKSVISVCKWTQIKWANRCILWLWKSRENLLVHLQQLKGVQSFKLGWVCESGSFSVNNGI